MTATLIGAGRLMLVPVAAATIVCVPTGCGAPLPPRERPPQCADGERVIRAAWFLDQRGRIPEWDNQPGQRFFYEIGDSVWCREVTDDQLLQTARTLIVQFPELCGVFELPPATEVSEFVDARTSGGPVRLVGWELGRETVQSRYVEAAAQLSCRR